MKLFWNNHRLRYFAGQAAALFFCVIMVAMIAGCGDRRDESIYYGTYVWEWETDDSVLFQTIELIPDNTYRTTEEEVKDSIVISTMTRTGDWRMLEDIDGVYLEGWGADREHSILRRTPEGNIVCASGDLHIRQ